MPLAILETRDYHGESVTLLRRRIATLTVTTGGIVACDPPTVEFDIIPFGLSIPPGVYPVVLTLAQWPPDEFNDTGGERVAYATLQIQDKQPVHWDLAPFEGAHPAESGYGVDTGTACFMDVEAARIFRQRMQADPDYGMVHEDIMEQRGDPNWSWAEVAFVPETRANMVSFSAGLGDGAYLTWAGYDASQTLVCLTTDFALLWQGDDQ